MNKAIAAAIGITALAGCATGPTQAELEYKAFDRVVSEKVAKGQMTAAEADLARQQYVGNLRSRESNIAAARGIAASNRAYADNQTALGIAMMCQGFGGCR